MNKKSPVLGAILGFFVLGLPYSGGMKKGLIGLVVLCIISWALASFVSPTVSIIANFAGAFLGHTWTNEYNANIDAKGVDSPATI
ncbi:MAG: phospho-N-acetylmuramoyl-pentapeptide-transferase [Schwartzia sp.]|nr:phospho-N-acetylmuramoyl-pentapeptide-transferase [Schwartzia sp. (in: firmicutes)]